MTLEINHEKTDLSKQLIDWALAAGRHFQSKQTGYVHLYNEENGQNAQTIPLLENFLFAYALLRSRTVEQMQEAKGLLKGLLVFQNRQENSLEGKGNFPVYLHEYPTCRDPALALRLVAPFFWILREFGHVLGADLKQALQEAAQRALDCSIQFHQNKPFPYFLSIRLAAAQLAFGNQEGEERLKELAQKQLTGWQNTRQLGSILVGLQMVYPLLSNSIWAPLWRCMQQTWHPQLACYIGPCTREWQEKEEPQVNLYDLFGGYFSGRFSSRAAVVNPHHLHGILIHPTSDSFGAAASQFQLNHEPLDEKDNKWTIVSTSSRAYTLLEKKEHRQPTVDKTHTPFRYVWGNLEHLHSLVCQGGNIEKVAYEIEEECVNLFVDLQDFKEEDHSKKEIEFFVDIHPEINFRVDGKTATTFELGQKLEMISGEDQLSIIFELIEGDGVFLGHIMRGNRPSQAGLKADNRLHAYDWTFFLRTIRRQGHCRLKVCLSIQEATFRPLIQR